jgi:hypothetical protein
MKEAPSVPPYAGGKLLVVDRVIGPHSVIEGVQA